MTTIDKIENECVTCLYECTKGSSISMCDVCVDYDCYTEGTKDEYMRMANKHRIKCVLKNYVNEVCGFTISDENLEELAEEVVKVIR